MENCTEFILTDCTCKAKKDGQACQHMIKEYIQQCLNQELDNVYDYKEWLFNPESFDYDSDIDEPISIEYEIELLREIFPFLSLPQQKYIKETLRGWINGDIPSVEELENAKLRRRSPSPTRIITIACERAEEQSTQMRCNICRNLGHNSSTCSLNST